MPRRRQAVSKTAASPPTPVNNSTYDDDDDGNGTPNISPVVTLVTPPDQDTLRILISTDQHLGYSERDPIRGLDSFAVFEEIFRKAKTQKVDLILFAGDLFHENKPSRRTLHKTMEIMRRYCMGPDAVRFQIVSDQELNFKRNVKKCVNYEDEFYSVDLPIFAIHGNHDDPTRDGGTDMLAALDLLAVTNLVNYFGRQDEVDNVEISPILIRKGSTAVALYGMGSMRDERLNRMWQNKKVRFLRPDTASTTNAEAEDDDDAVVQWFNLFTLHQNRDLGRGSKNCVHESMIPEWMDLVVWGHEHECLIEPTDSLVGTFRICQPGSSVATSLTPGESVRKHVGILEIRGEEFRITPLPLVEVRPFAMGEVVLSDVQELSIDDPNIDGAIGDVLEEKVRDLIEEAREKNRELREKAASTAEDEDLIEVKRYTLQKPNEVLVRLKVDHSGFSTLNNQRFGAKFVGEVANPSDILLFHRRRQTSDTPSVSKSSKSRQSAISNNSEPIPPEDLAEINVEDLIKENLDISDKKLQILNEQSLGIALEEFVVKEQARAIGETVQDILRVSQKQLNKRGSSSTNDNDGNKVGGVVTTSAGVREIVKAEAEKMRAKALAEADEQEATIKKSNGVNGVHRVDSSESGDEMNNGSRSTRKQVVSKAKAASSTRATSKTAQKRKATEIDDSDDDVVQEIHPPSQRNGAFATGRPTRRAAASSKGRYIFDDDDDDDGSINGNNSNDPDVKFDVAESSDNLSDEEPPPTKQRGKKAPASTRKSRAKPTLSLASSTKRASNRASTTSSSRLSSRAGSSGKLVYDVDDDSDDDDRKKRGRGLAAAWSTNNTQSQPARRRRR